MLGEAQERACPLPAPASPLAAEGTAVGAGEARREQQELADQIQLLTRQLEQAEVMAEAIKRNLQEGMSYLREDAARRLREVTDWTEEQIQERMTQALGAASEP